jgi:predicted RNA polymerase sigma factor
MVGTMTVQAAELVQAAATGGDLLAKLGRSVEARVEFERAVELTSNEAERADLLARAMSA